MSVAETMATEFRKQIAYRIGCKTEIIPPNALEGRKMSGHTVLIKVDPAHTISAIFGREDVTFSGNTGERPWASPGPAYGAAKFDEQIDQILTGHGVRFKKTLGEWEKSKNGKH